MAAGAPDQFSVTKIFAILFRLLGPERNFYFLAILYGVGISLLSLATPISVQMLINNVANTALATPLVVLSGTPFVLLLMSGLLNALRFHLMEIFGRRFYARMVAEIALRDIGCNTFIYLDHHRQHVFASFDTFNAVVYEPRRQPAPGGPSKPVAAIGSA